MKNKTFLLLVSMFLSAGCATESSLLKDAHGESVRSMIYHQIADPQVAANPDLEPVLEQDGSRAERVHAVHTDNVTRAEETTNEINLNIGD